MYSYPLIHADHAFRGHVTVLQYRCRWCGLCWSRGLRSRHLSITEKSSIYELQDSKKQYFPCYKPCRFTNHHCWVSYALGMFCHFSKSLQTKPRLLSDNMLGILWYLPQVAQSLFLFPSPWCRTEAVPGPRSWLPCELQARVYPATENGKDG